ncbi:hypothetical protein GN958_ATG02277 [Phytophthora infestans]|uniref:Sfi1 spindle body domain-containing protein n=1 Tax=Phytophthora infestans TaxID=4787 RepID=A0A8S9V6N5_PHYIN|nr:hypothetical protein GN958_ATG02277 [Phytophthora infestans]
MSKRHVVSGAPPERCLELSSARASTNDMPASWTASTELHSPQYPRDYVPVTYSPPPSPGLSFEDEDVEYIRGIAVQNRPVNLRRAPEKGFNRKLGRARNLMRVGAYRDKNVSQYSSRPRSHLNEINEKLYSSRPGEVYVTTLNEGDQQMFIALFYWRRKVIQAHFSAWKWVVFVLRRSAKKLHRHGRHTRPSKLISMGYDSIDLRPLRRNLILKRHTGMSSAEESDKIIRKPVQPQIHVVGVRGVDINSLEGSNRPSEDLHSIEKRRQFRAELCLAYCCFDQWRSQADTSRKTRVQQLEKVRAFHREQSLKKAIRAWKRDIRLNKAKRKRLNDADQCHWNRTKRAVFNQLKRYYRVEREITRRRRISAAQRKRLAFQHWRCCVWQTQKCRMLSPVVWSDITKKMYEAASEAISKEADPTTLQINY